MFKVLALLACLTTIGFAGAGRADPCLSGATFRYPLAEALRLEARELHFAEYWLIDWSALAAQNLFEPTGKEYRQAVLEAVHTLPPDTRDMRLLALLDVAFVDRGDSMIAATTLSVSAIIDLLIDTTARQGLSDQSAALKAAKNAYPVWNTTPAKRRAQWTDGTGKITNPVLREALRVISRRYNAAQPKPIDRALELVRADPALLAHYEAMRRDTSDDIRMEYLMSQVFPCLTDWSTPATADAVLERTAQPQRDLILLHMFLGEAFNGSVHQYFFNSSGTLAPQLAETLARHGLADHAAAIRRGMAEYATPYPRATPQRRAQMRHFSPAKDTALERLTAFADDGVMNALMHRIARENGLFPE
ncbi:DUF4375 domain-containing protein [Rhodobacteraceae bacterium D3-12]|nr:DUF4375 domain-containing protein [Rhodobacteraceae bacterium D3-12]